MDSVTLFADTNAFIQLRDLKDIPWRKLFTKVKQVRIMVARPVIEELDKHKTSTNDRRRKRARLALNLISQASKANGRVLTLKDTPFLVTLELPPRTKLDWESMSILDPNSADDRLVAEALTFGNGASVFSHDSGPRITAHDLGLDAHEPLDDWHLEPEQSDADKRIALLERQLKAAQSNKPRLAIEIEGRDEARKVAVYRPILPALDSEQVARLLKRYLAEYPRASPVASSSNIMAMAYHDGLTRAQVDSYHSDYDAFEDRAKSFFERLHELSYYFIVPTVGVKTKNLGSASAIDFHVTLQTTGGVGILSSPNAIRKLSPFPEPPEEPEPRGYLSGMHNRLLSSAMIPEPPHPTTIVWIDKPSYSDTKGRYGCKDFQPERSDSREVSLWPIGDFPAQGVLTVTAGANDVPDISEACEVSISEREESWDSPVVVASLPEFLRADLAQ